MAQTPVVHIQEGESLDFIASGDVLQGTVLLFGTIVAVADHDVKDTKQGAASVEGLKEFPKDASTFADGDEAYWDPTGSPVGGTASSGALTSTATNYPVGYIAPLTTAGTFPGALTGDGTARVNMTSFKVVGQLPDSIGGSTAAAGSSTTDATVLPAGTAKTYPTTAADDTKGVRLHASDKVTGRKIFIGNGVANKILKVYAPTGGTINGGSADAAFSSVSGKGVIIQCLSSGSNTWLAW